MEPINNNNPDLSTHKPAHRLFKSKTFIWTTVILAELILLIAVFDLGIHVALHKARYTDSWARNYGKNFGDSRMFGRLPTASPEHDGDFMPAHGLAGTIISLDKNNLTLKSVDNVEKTVLVSASTIIRMNFQNLQAADLKPGQEVVIIGSPNDNGQIDAKIIRIIAQ